MRLEKKATMENAKELRIEAMEKDTILGKNAERILKIIPDVSCVWDFSHNRHILFMHPYGGYTA